MRYVVAIIAGMAASAAFADTRLELDTGTVHAPYDQANADLEYKNTDGATSIVSVQLANGNYNATYFSLVKNVFRATAAKGVNLDKVDQSGKDSVKTTCATTDGTFQDDDGNAYTTNNCFVKITVYRTKRPEYYDVEYDIGMWNAVAAATAKENKAYPAPAGQSVMFRGR